MPKQSLKFAISLSAIAAAGYLEDLAGGLRQGRVSLESGSRNVAFDAGGNLSFELKAKSNPDQGRSSLEIKLDWRERTRLNEPSQSLIVHPSKQTAPQRQEPETPVASADTDPGGQSQVCDT
jgi:amphi-Trp domain-containing protein